MRRFQSTKATKARAIRRSATKTVRKSSAKRAKRNAKDLRSLGKGYGALMRALSKT